VRTPDEIWADRARLLAEAESASDERKAAIDIELQLLAEEAEDVAGVRRERELRSELEEVEDALATLAAQRIGGPKKKRNFVMGFVWGDHDSAVHMAELNRRMDEAGGRTALEERRAELRRLLGID
jgi:hypothetical protein